MTIVVFVKGNSASFIKETERAKNHHACCWKIRQKAEGNRFLVVYIICKELFPRAESMMLLFREEKSKRILQSIHPPRVAGEFHSWREMRSRYRIFNYFTSFVVWNLSNFSHSLIFETYRLTVCKIQFYRCFSLLAIVYQILITDRNWKMSWIKKKYWCFLRVTSC